MEGDVLRRVPRRAGNRQRGVHALGIGRGPLQHLHAAHRAADHREQRVDAEPVDQHRLRAHHVGDGDDGEIQAPHLAGRGIDRGRPGRAHAAADHVGADDEVVLRIKRSAGTDQRLPPAGLAGDGMHVGDVLVAGQRMADQHRVGAIGVELAIGLVGDLERGEIDAAIEPQRLLGAELRDLRTRMIHLMRPVVGTDRGTRNGLDANHLTIDLVCDHPSADRMESGHEKPGLNDRFGRDRKRPRPV